MPMGPSAYLVGRKGLQLTNASTDVTDSLIAAQRLDKWKILNRRFSHTTFANVSFMEAELRDTEFLDCAFLNCYFRKSQIVNCSFVGSKFYGCDFPKVSVRSSDFRYSRFFSCAIPFDEMEHNLPPEPNLREEVAMGLAIAADERGWGSQARQYLLSAIAAREDHLAAAVQGRSSWYREHYPTLRRLGALIQLTGSKLNGLLWGHGERWTMLLRNLAILAFLVFPVVLWVVRTELRVAGGGTPQIVDILWLSITTIVPVSAVSFVNASGTTSRTILTLEAFAGIVIAGLFVTLLLRSVVRR